MEGWKPYKRRGNRQRKAKGRLTGRPGHTEHRGGDNRDSKRGGGRQQRGEANGDGAGEGL